MSFDLTDPGAVAAALYGSPMQFEMTIRLGQALEFTDALWDLVPVVVAAGKEHDDRDPAAAADSSPASQRMPAETRSRLRDLALRWEEQWQAALVACARDESAVTGWAPAEAQANPFALMASLVDMPALASQMLSAVEGAPVTSVDELQYLSTFLRARSREPRAPLLLRALFVTAVGTAEPLITRMTQLLLHHTQPGTYPSMADSGLEKKARDLCFGGPEKWRAALVHTLGVSVLADLIDWASLGKLWEDRNALIHRGGLVDARHSSRTGTTAGTVLSPSPGEVQSAIDVIGAARYGIVAAVWDHLAPRSGRAAAIAAGAPIFESLAAGRWRQAEGLGKVQEAFAADAETAAIARVNQWLALERGLGTEAVREQVLAWDTTGLSAEFQIARHILLHEDEAALQLLSDLMANGTLGVTALASWPLFDRLRSHGQLRQWLDTSDH